jgi:hypothetical protein
MLQFDTRAGTAVIVFAGAVFVAVLVILAM